MIQVTAAVIVKDSKILIAQRNEYGKLPLKWEFPGGKVEGNETCEECLQRELWEEFSINAVIGEYICTSKFNYDCYSIELIAFFVKWFDGEIKLANHSQVKWVSPSELDDFDFAPADIPIVNEVKRRLLK